jgi:hypothetical protein
MGLDERSMLQRMPVRAKTSEKHLSVAKAVLLDGKPFRQAAVNAGYSAASAHMGPKAMRRESKGLDSAFKRVESEIQWQPTQLKQIAVSRITRTCLDDKNSDNLKAAELIGRFKSVDLFVRNGDAQVGIFFGAVEASDADIASLEVKALSAENTDSRLPEGEKERK